MEKTFWPEQAGKAVSLDEFLYQRGLNFTYQSCWCYQQRVFYEQQQRGRWRRRERGPRRKASTGLLDPAKDQGDPSGRSRGPLGLLYRRGRDGQPSLSWPGWSGRRTVPVWFGCPSPLCLHAHAWSRGHTRRACLCYALCSISRR